LAALVFILEVEVFFGVVISNAGYYLGEHFHIHRILTVLCPSTDEVAHNTSEVFVTRIRNKRAAISKHTDEAGEHTEISKRLHLSYHTVSLIVEPPTRAELNLSGDGSLLEITEHGTEPNEHLTIAVCTIGLLPI